MSTVHPDGLRIRSSSTSSMVAVMEPSKRRDTSSALNVSSVASTPSVVNVTSPSTTPTYS